MKPPCKVFDIDCTDGSKAVVFPCITHGSHVVVGGGFPGAPPSAALHLEVSEAMQLADVVRAGSSWAGLGAPPTIPGAGVPPFDRTGLVHVKCGVFMASVRASGYYLTLAVRGFPITLLPLDDAGRERLAAAVVELAYGKPVAA